MTVETPEAALYEMTDVAVDGVPVNLPRISWRASKLRFERPLVATFTFSDRGGYVALARHYQRHFKRWGFYKTLRQAIWLLGMVAVWRVAGTHPATRCAGVS